jgi:hypothetical protein
MFETLLSSISDAPSYVQQLWILCGLLLLWLWSTPSNELVGLKTIFSKMLLWVQCIIYMVLSKDNKGIGVKYQTPENDPQLTLDKHRKNEIETSTKQIIFIRHGESDWNMVFNRGKNFGMLFRLARALITEWSMAFSLDSPFLDSPLNSEGIEQALELRKYIEESPEDPNPKRKELLSILRGDANAPSTSIVVSSILRRAIATTTLALWPRLNRNDEKMNLMTPCQEISRNVDTCSIAPVNSVPDLPFARIAPHCGGHDKCNTKLFNTSMNTGNKTLSNKGKDRIEEFNKWAFECEEDTIIVGGHSLWFKSYFNLYLPYNSTHKAKTEKITNSGVIAFTIHKSVSGKDYFIDPESIETVYGGFTKK